MDSGKPEEAPADVFEQPTVLEVMKELERVELALVSERQRSAQLSEQKRLAEEAYSRDVDMLEKMLLKAEAENAKLTQRIEELESQPTLKAGPLLLDRITSNEQKLPPCDQVQALQSSSGSELEEPEMEYPPLR
mmetsp:Transcript_53527/g.127597  ORF Transcript_53527/g.127597 Transcript_53527/m.127597 type:complete len:134 (-) Transcript_53527:193-594(-)